MLTAVASSTASPAPPVTLAQFTMGGSGGKDLYDVSLVDGFNLPMLAPPLASTTARRRGAWWT
jgi:hypothetical protein